MRRTIKQVKGFILLLPACIVVQPICLLSVTSSASAAIGDESADNNQAQQVLLQPLKPKLDGIDKKGLSKKEGGDKDVSNIVQDLDPNLAKLDNYPTVGTMEAITLGHSNSGLSIEERLSALEQAVFKITYKDESLFDRSQRLRGAILGSTNDTYPSEFERAELDANSLLPLITPPVREKDVKVAEVTYFDHIAKRPENQVEVNHADIASFALELANFVRRQAGLSLLSVDEIAARMASEHALDLAQRNVISHANGLGENPDLRYTKIGGTDAVTESVLSVAEAKATARLTRAMVARAFKLILARQDDRDALLSPDATGLGFSLEWMKSNKALLSCMEISTKHGNIQPLSTSISVGNKIEIKGFINEPYHFEKISIAWEGVEDGHLASASEESEDALPYFPPLDYVAFASRAEHDYEKTINTLRAVGLVAAIAGSVFMPPVALAAPMIVASGSFSEPKPLSDIPVHGGVKLEGSEFSGKIPISNAGKAGLYYITIWASTGRYGKSVPISRRAYSVTASNQVESESSKKSGRARHG